MPVLSARARTHRLTNTPPQILAQTSPKVNVWQQIGATEPKLAAAQLMKQNDNFGYKAPTQMLEQKGNSFPSVWQQIGVQVIGSETRGGWVGVGGLSRVEPTLV